MPSKGTGVTGSTRFNPRSHNAHPTGEGSYAGRFSVGQSRFWPFDPARHRRADCPTSLLKPCCEPVASRRRQRQRPPSRVKHEPPADPNARSPLPAQREDLVRPARLPVQLAGHQGLLMPAAPPPRQRGGGVECIFFLARSGLLLSACKCVALLRSSCFLHTLLTRAISRTCPRNAGTIDLETAGVPPAKVCGPVFCSRPLHVLLQPCVVPNPSRFFLGSTFATKIGTAPNDSVLRANNSGRAPRAVAPALRDPACPPAKKSAGRTRDISGRARGDAG